MKSLSRIKVAKHIQDPNRKSHTMCEQPILEVEQWTNANFAARVSCRACEMIYYGEKGKS